MDERILWLEGESPVAQPALTWCVLAVDDDADFQRATAFALDELQVLGGRIELLQAFSYREASAVFARRPDIALVLLDVVMETDDAGLRLVRTLREVIGNSEVRIVLLTGEPGMAPVQDVMREYDINDYWSKSELTADRLLTVLTAGLRSFAQLRSVTKARRGLQMIVESSNALFCSKSQHELAGKVLGEIGFLLDQPAEGLICMREDMTAPGGPLQGRVISATGRFQHARDTSLDSLDEPEVVNAVRSAFDLEAVVRRSRGLVLYLPRLQAGADYACYLETACVLDDTDLELLRVFSASISRGLYNVTLFRRLEEMAYQDELLKIPNRNALLRMLDLTLQDEQLRSEQVLVLIDIDNFSGANTAFGTGYGDFILGLVARRLRDAFASKVLVARVRDDLFAILGPQQEVRAAAVVALFRRQGRPYELGQVHSLSSVTLRLADFVGSAHIALQSALLTLKQAKSAGYDQHVIHDPGLQRTHAESYRMLLALRDAVEAGRISIELQPQLDLNSGAVIGVEALARWRQADGQSVPPLQFIPLAETTGYILPLGDLLLRLSLQAAKRLADAGYGGIRVAVNVSAAQLLQPDFVERFDAHLRAAEVRAQQVEVEITESVAMRNFDSVCTQLSALRERGVSVAIDDFGTGFSSLSYLRLLPADRLKIDRSFIMEIGAVADHQLIAEAVIQIAARVGMQVIAEGVETPLQADWVRQHGCHEAQGYLFGKPMPCDQLLNWLAEQGQATA
ncbi:MAG: EAL domain-containing protein [Gammaproteobacteria bacterium]|nr:EAL domain-containing protein [Gammaproteobacteria bacterium]MBU2067629.1 EAL domain-containing protein [Gammaproteobacteria bacterium]MBU2157672.1 EAL domain-containing protein [Gammaproteobacteria bacterium]MBU2218516.1 EAL domain-containing protein [Gammaproteobacteria bacterium]MBU2324117.1 EAL domain-containing protein [Gammaproteobacteria bacterium]